MKYSAALILLLAATVNAAVRTRRDRDRDNDDRITNGIPADVGQFPFQADVQGNRVVGPTMCSGALISSDWVLTDAVCIDRATNWTVTVGMTVRNDTEDDRQVQVSTEAYMHPDYNYLIYADELGAIKLPNPFTLTDNVMPAVLPTRTEANGSYIGTEVTVSGWGWASELTPGPSDDLLYVSLNVTNNTLCEEFYSPTVDMDDKLCAASDNVTNPCDLDDGAPMVTSDNQLIGIFMVLGGCETELPTIYIRIASWLDWIETTTGITILP